MEIEIDTQDKRKKKKEKRKYKTRILDPSPYIEPDSQPNPVITITDLP